MDEKDIVERLREWRDELADRGLVGFHMAAEIEQRFPEVMREGERPLAEDDD